MLSAFFTRLRLARFNAHEASGSLGDLGTFLPLVLAMAQQNGLDLGVALFFAGLLNLLTGFLFIIPMAVQPMKAIAAVALTQGLTVPQILAAGMLVSAVVLVLGLLGWVGKLARAIPDSVVRGLQLGLGLSLALKGIEMAALPGLDRWLLALPAALLGWWLLGSRRIPIALLLFAGGILLALFRHPEAFQSLRLGLHLPHFVVIAPLDWWTAFTKAAIPQVPLTLLNSVVAVCALARDLQPSTGPHGTQGGRKRGPYESAHRRVRRHAHVPWRGWPGGPVGLRREDPGLNPAARSGQGDAGPPLRRLPHGPGGGLSQGSSGRDALLQWSEPGGDQP